MGLCLWNLYRLARHNRSPSFFIQYWNCSGSRVLPVQTLYNTRRTFGNIQHHTSPAPCVKMMCWSICSQLCFSMVTPAESASWCDEPLKVVLVLLFDSKSYGSSKAKHISEPCSLQLIIQPNPKPKISFLVSSSTMRVGVSMMETERDRLTRTNPFW